MTNILVAKSLHILVIFEWLHWLLCFSLWVYSPSFFALSVAQISGLIYPLALGNTGRTLEEGSREKWVILFWLPPCLLWIVITCILVLHDGSGAWAALSQRSVLRELLTAGYRTIPLLVSLNLALALIETSSLNRSHLPCGSMPSVSWQDLGWEKHAPIPGIFCISNCLPALETWDGSCRKVGQELPFLLWLKTWTPVTIEQPPPISFSWTVTQPHGDLSTYDWGTLVGSTKKHQERDVQPSPLEIWPQGLCLSLTCPWCLKPSLESQWVERGRAAISHPFKHLSS